MMKKVLRVIILLFLGFSILALSRDVYDQVQRLENIQYVESQSKKLEEENSQLKESVEIKATPFSLEKEARDKLSYKKEGDTIYVVDIDSKQEAEQKKQLANWKQWVELFFR